jgi:hypothetical protein
LAHPLGDVSPGRHSVWSGGSPRWLARTPRAQGQCAVGTPGADLLPCGPAHVHQ